jgi:hypothetical protein
VAGIVRVGGRGDQLVAVDTAAVLGRARAPPASAGHPRSGLLAGENGFELDDVLPVVTEVVAVEQPPAELGKNLVEAHLMIGNAGLAFVHLERAEVVLGVVAVIVRAGAEPVQVAVGPAERGLDDVVDLVEIKVGSEFKPAPERRLCPLRSTRTRYVTTTGRPGCRREGGGGCSNGPTSLPAVSTCWSTPSRSSKLRPESAALSSPMTSA